MKHERFNYKNLEEIKAKAEELKVHLPFAENTEALKREAIRRLCACISAESAILRSCLKM